MAQESTLLFVTYNIDLSRRAEEQVDIDAMVGTLQAKLSLPY
jgi:hypothetical protein